MLHLFSKPEDYNSGVLHGRWIECLQDFNEVQGEINAMLAELPYPRHYGDPAEEWAIHDHGGWHGMSISEFKSIEGLCELAEALEEYGNLW